MMVYIFGYTYNTIRQKRAVLHVSVWVIERNYAANLLNQCKNPRAHSSFAKPVKMT